MQGEDLAGSMGIWVCFPEPREGALSNETLRIRPVAIGRWNFLWAKALQNCLRKA